MSSALFDFVKNRLPIVDIIQEYASIKRAGNYWKAPCPFHNETAASFTVSPDKGIFYCFGCQATGDVVGFVAKMENLQPLEALNFIAEKRGLVIPDELRESMGSSKQDLEQKERYFTLCKKVALWLHGKLFKSSEALEYLSKRAITDETIRSFGIGFFPGGLSEVTHFIKTMQTQNILLSDLIEAGFVVQSRGVVHSPFEERIIFPIKDQMGRFCGFGGRIFKEGDTRAKYYNSKESEWFNKRALLFGLDAAKKTIQSTEHVFLVEGYFDAVGMVQAGYPNTVATLGTACTGDHLKILGRFAKYLYVLYDGDNAGQKAMLRLAEMCWEYDVEPRAIRLPAAEDPFSFLFKGNSLEPFIERALDIFAFYIESKAVGFRHKPLADKMALARDIIETISHIKDPLKRDILFAAAARELEIPFETLKGHASYFERSKEALPEGQHSPENEGEEDSLVGRLEEKLLCAILTKLAAGVTVLFPDNTLISCLSEKIKNALKVLEKHASSGKNLFEILANELNEQDYLWLASLAMRSEQMTDEEYRTLIAKLEKEHWKKKVYDIKDLIEQAKKQGDEQAVQELLGTFLRLRREMHARGLV